MCINTFAYSIFIYALIQCNPHAPLERKKYTRNSIYSCNVWKFNTSLMF